MEPRATAPQNTTASLIRSLAAPLGYSVGTRVMRGLVRGYTSAEQSAVISASLNGLVMATDIYFGIRQAQRSERWNQLSDTEKNITLSYLIFLLGVNFTVFNFNRTGLAEGVQLSIDMLMLAITSLIIDILGDNHPEITDEQLIPVQEHKIFADITNVPHAKKSTEISDISVNEDNSENNKENIKPIYLSSR